MGKPGTRIGGRRWCSVCGQLLGQGRRKYCSTVCADRWANRKHHTKGVLTAKEWLIWMAGFFDGEGSMVISQLQSGGFLFAISVSQTKSDASLVVFKETFGGAVYRTPERGNRAAAYHWQVSGAKAIAAVRQMWPYFLVKRPQAEVAEEWAKLGPVVRTPELAVRRKERQQELHEEMVALNKRGPEVT